MTLAILPFSDEHLDAAATVLAAAHARHLATEPLLGHVEDYREQVARQWEREGASGAIAVRDGTPVGYLIGGRAPNDNRGGTRIYTDIAGHATAEPELARDLFAAAAERWHEEGHERFAVVVPAHDAALVDAWFRVGFGLQFATAVREATPGPRADADTQAAVSIRPGTRDDLVHVARFDRELWLHQTRSPSFSGLDVPEPGEFEDEWRDDTFDSPDTFWPFIVELSGEVIGEAVMYRRPTGDLRVPAENVDLAHAVVDPAARGSGAGLVLTSFVLDWAHRHGFRSITTDWRSVNLLASRFWPNRGWRPTYLRLYRVVP